MTDDNPRRTFLARRAHGVREVHVPTVVNEERRQEAWLEAVDHIEQEMRRLKGEKPAGHGPCSLS